MEEEIKYEILKVKLRRIQELNIKAKKSLLKERMPTSQSSLSIINYCLENIDYLIPVLWKNPQMNNFEKYQVYKKTRKLKMKDPGCCTIV